MKNDSSDQHFTMAVDVAVEAIKALLLVNGGAATALIALSEKTNGIPKFGLAILLFGTAALTNACTMVIGYFSQLSYANHRLEVESKQDGLKSLERHEALQTIATLVLAISLALSGAAMYFAYRAL